MMNVISSDRDSMVEIRQRASKLVELAVALGIPLSRLADHETFDSVEVRHPIAYDSAINWDVDVITSSLALLGSDVELIITVDGAEPAFDVPSSHLHGQSVSKSDIDEFIESLRTLSEDQGNDLTVYARLSVKKAKVCEHLENLLSHRPGYLGASALLAQTKAVVFFQSAPWQKLLTVQALWNWENMGLLSHGRRLVVVLCDAEGYVGGTAIEVLGAQSNGRLPWHRVSQEIWDEFLERDVRMRALCSEESNWSVGLETLTPDYFELNEIVPGLHETAVGFDRMRAALSAAYMANSVQPDKGSRRLILRFSGARPSQMFLPFKVNDSEPSGDFTQHGLSNLTRWAYLHGSPDKLMIARECLAHSLTGKAWTDLEFVESQAADALDASKSHFVSYLRNNTKQYFQLREQAVDAVIVYAGEVEKSVSDLTSDLVSNVYKVAGLLAAAIAAVLIEPAVTVQVIGLTVFVQICYVLFIVCYALPAQERRYGGEKTSLDRRLKVMTELEEKERTDIRNIGGRADEDFKTGYRKAQLIYLWMCGACILIGLLAAIILQGTHVAAPSAHNNAPTPQVTGTR